MADDDDDSQKTEEPTQRRIDEAVKRGQVVNSREVTSFMVLLALSLVVGWMSPYLLRNTASHLTRYIENADDYHLDANNLGHLLTNLLKDIAPTMLIPALFVMVAAVGSSLIQNGGFLISAYPITPRLDKISPLSGFGRIFSMQSVIELLKGIAKISILGIVGFIAVYPELIVIGTLHDYSIAGILLILLKLAIRILIGICIAMAMIAILDYMYQRHHYFQGLRMTKQEIKDEYKTSEGSPEIKQKIRAIRMERARKRMMAAVPKADVIITNPTHFSVALQYNALKMRAPTVIAKGQDNIALKIREIAKKHDIPIVENPPLARALFDSVEIDEEVPFEHYKAVAEVIGYVYKMKGKMT